MFSEGSRSLIHDVAFAATYKGWEGWYISTSAGLVVSLSRLCRRVMFMLRWITISGYIYWCCNKWPNGWLLNSELVFSTSISSVTIGASEQDYPLSTGGRGIERGKRRIRRHFFRTLLLPSLILKSEFTTGSKWLNPPDGRRRRGWPRKHYKQGRGHAMDSHFLIWISRNRHQIGKVKKTRRY